MLSSQHYGSSLREYAMRRPAVRWAVLAGSALAAAAAAEPSRAQEEAGPQPNDGVYLTVGGSLGAVNDPRTTDDFIVDLGAETGFFAGLGYGLGPFRFETVLLAEQFPVNNLHRGGATALPPGDYAGALNSIGVMTNVLVEMGNRQSVRPYLGIGGGFASMEPDYRDDICFIFCSQGPSAAAGSDTVAAWQGMAGITVASRQFGGEWDFGYRFFAANSTDFRLADGTPFTQDGVRAHSFQIGYRHYFGGAAD